MARMPGASRRLSLLVLMAWFSGCAAFEDASNVLLDSHKPDNPNGKGYAELIQGVAQAFAHRPASVGR